MLELWGEVKRASGKAENGWHLNKLWVICWRGGHSSSSNGFYLQTSLAKLPSVEEEFGRDQHGRIWALLPSCPARLNRWGGGAIAVCTPCLMAGRDAWAQPLVVYSANGGAVWCVIPGSVCNFRENLSCHSCSSHKVRDIHSESALWLKSFA